MQFIFQRELDFIDFMLNKMNSSQHPWCCSLQKWIEDGAWEDFQALAVLEADFYSTSDGNINFNINCTYIFNTATSADKSREVINAKKQLLCPFLPLLTWVFYFIYGHVDWCGPYWFYQKEHFSFLSWVLLTS